MLPQFFLAGVFNPIHDLPPVLAVLSALSPMRWAVEAVRHVYYATQPGLVAPELSPAPVVAAVIAVSFVGFIAVGTARYSCGPSGTAEIVMIREPFARPIPRYG